MIPMGSPRAAVLATRRKEHKLGSREQPGKLPRSRVVRELKSMT